MDEAGGADAARPVERELGAADVDVVELSHVVRGMNHRRGVKHRGAPHAFEERVERDGIADVADDGVDARIEDFERTGVGLVVHETPNVAPALLGERPDEILAEPSAGTGYDGGRGSRTTLTVRGHELRRYRPPRAAVPISRSCCPNVSPWPPPSNRRQLSGRQTPQ